MVLASTCMDRVANSTPMVDLESRLNSLRVKRLNRLDLPTPESPMRTTRCSWVLEGEDGLEQQGRGGSSYLDYL